MTKAWSKLGTPVGLDVFPSSSRLRVLPRQEEIPAASLSEAVWDKEKSYGEMRFPPGSCLCACSHPGLGAPEQRHCFGVFFPPISKVEWDVQPRHVCIPLPTSLLSPPTLHPSSLHHPPGPSQLLPASPEPHQLLLKPHVKTPLACARPAWLLSPAETARTGWR